MRLIIRITDAEAVPGGKSLILCDEDGIPLPGQIGVSATTAIGENSIVTVQFAVDGEKVRFV